MASLLRLRPTRNAEGQLVFSRRGVSHAARAVKADLLVDDAAQLPPVGDGQMSELFPDPGAAVLQAVQRTGPRPSPSPSPSPDPPPPSERLGWIWC